MVFEKGCYRDYAGGNALTEYLSPGKKYKVGDIAALVKCGNNVNKPDYQRKTPLMLAIENSPHDDVGIAQFLVDKGAIINAQDIFGKTSLMTAVKKNFDMTSRMLIDK